MDIRSRELQERYTGIKHNWCDVHLLFETSNVTAINYLILNTFIHV